jgi:DNA adenine methylase Dam
MRRSEMNSWFTVSPLNYIGGKARILDQLLPVFPEHISTFVDLFCGGCNVGINTNAEKYIYNDGNSELIGLLKMFLRLNTTTILNRLDEIVEHYSFSKTKDHSFAYYGGNPMIGVSRYNKEPFLRLRQDYNNSPRNNQHYIMLYALVVFGFNNQMRFNDRGEYNLPVGKRDFNDVIRRKLEVFVNKLKGQHPLIQNKDFRRFDIKQIDNESLVYLDPPYLISTATYNEGGGWTERDESDLLGFMDELNARGIKFVLSNMLEHKGRKNQLLIDWIEQRNLQVVGVNMDYSNSNYQVEGKDSGTVEVLVKNY